MENRIGIIGLGAIGSVLSKYLLSNANNKLSFYNRSHKNNISIDFLDHHFSSPVQCISPPYPSEELEWIILCLKEHQITPALPLIRQVLSKNSVVVVIRNGLNHVSDLKKHISHATLLPCLIDCSVQRNQEKGFHQLSPPILTMPESKLSADFQTLFHSQEVDFNVTNDFKTESWKKLIESASLGAVQCMAGKPCIIFQEQKYKDQFRDFIREGIHIAQMDGAKLNEDFEQQLLSKLMQYPGDKGSSMLTDLLAGKPLELGAKNGAILEKAKHYRINAPLNELFCKRINTV